VASKNELEVTIKPTAQELRKRLRVKRDAVMNLRTPLAQAAVLLDQWVQKNFKSEGGKVGGWAPFKVGGRWKTNSKGRTFDASAKLLQDTGRLRASFTPFADKKQAGIGSDLPYAKPHHKGEEGLPARPMLPDKNPAKAEVTRAAREVMAAWNKKALNS